MDFLKVAKIESCKNWKLQKLKVAKVEMSSAFLAKLPNCQVAKLPICQIAKLPSCQIAKLQVAKLWTCDHGAKSLSFLFVSAWDKSHDFNPNRGMPVTRNWVDLRR